MPILYHPRCCFNKNVCLCCSMCNTVFEVCIQCCYHLKKKKPPVVLRMEHILNQTPAVLRLFSQADTLQRKQRERAVREGDWLMYADAGDITAQEVFRINMAKSHRVMSFTSPAALSGEEGGVSPRSRVTGGTMRTDFIETEREDTSLEDDEDKSMPERDPKVREVVIQSEEEEMEQEKAEMMSSMRLSEVTHLDDQLAGYVSKDEVCITPSNGSTKLLAIGPMCPIPTHAAFTRSKEKTHSESRIKDVSEMEILPRKKQKIDDFVTVPVSKKSFPQKKYHRQKSSDTRAKTVHDEEVLVPSIPREKRLFRSYTDLVHFDIDLKHQTPIGAYEFEFLMKLEKHDKAQKEWECTLNKPECQVYKLKGDSPVVLVKAYATFEGLSVQLVAHFIRHIPTRAKWDKTFEDFRLVEKNVEGNEVIYCLMRAPWPIANRDFLQWRRTNVGETEVAIIMRSASHPDFKEKAGVIRAETILSGYIVRPINNNPDSAGLFLIAQTDIRGLLPKFAVNQGAQRAPIQWTDALKKACTEYKKRYGDKAPVYEDLVSCI